MAIDDYAVIGNPVAQSKSPQIHQYFAQLTGQKLAYRALCAPLDGFASVVQDFIKMGGKGANVTAPFKEAAFSLVDKASPRAQCAKAVNTLTFCTETSQILGENTDGIGLIQDITCNAGMILQHQRVLLLGAGGAARGVLAPLLATKPRVLIVANRTAAKARTLVQAFDALAKPQGIFFAGGGLSNFLQQIARMLGGFDIVINASSQHLHGDTIAVPAEIFSSNTLAYDMAYGQTPTAFLQYAALHGAGVRDGFGMLVEQAAESFFIWRGIRPPTQSLLTNKVAL